MGLTDVLRERTAELHRQAEQTGIVAEIIRGTASRAKYALYLGNLLPAYRSLEASLARAEGRLGGLLRPELLRTEAIERDLAKLEGTGWADVVPLLEVGRRYGARVAHVAEVAPDRLIAHAYTRYLGDLAGGRALRHHLAASLGLDSSCLSFYEFPAAADPRALARDYRAALDSAGAGCEDREAVIEEAGVAFGLNIEVSCAVQSHVARPGGRAQRN